MTRVLTQDLHTPLSIGLHNEITLRGKLDSCQGTPSVICRGGQWVTAIINAPKELSVKLGKGRKETQHRT